MSKFFTKNAYFLIHNFILTGSSYILPRVHKRYGEYLLVNLGKFNFMKLVRFQKAVLCILFSSLFLLELPAVALRIESGSGNFLPVKRFVFDTVQVNLEELATSAEKIFAGKCTDIEKIDKDPKSGLSVIKFTFKVSDAIKGIDGNKTISFKQWEPTTRNAPYEIGKKYVLFLHGDSRIGLTSPVGFLQGQFEINKENDGRDTVKNKVSNKGLVRNLKSQKKLLLRDSYRQSILEEKSEKGEGIDYNNFVESVKNILEN